MRMLTKLSFAILSLFVAVNSFASYTWTANYGGYRSSASTPYTHSNKVVTDPNGHEQEYIYKQGFGSPQLISNSFVVNGVSTIWLDSEYDTNGRLLAIKDQQTKFGRGYTYNVTCLDWLMSQTDPELGTTNYTYYANGLRATEQTNNSSKTKFVYDANGNVTSIIYSASADNSIPVAPTVNSNYDPNNNLATTTVVDAANKPLSSITFGYDALNRLTSMSFADGYGLGNGSLNYAYDNNGALASIHYPDGLIIAYNPNPLGQPTQLVRTDRNFQTLVIGDIKYSPFNTITSYQGGVNVTHTLDAMGRISNIAVGSIVNRTYSYDGENNVLSITNNLNTAENESFTYDYANRLITANGVWGAASYHYDMGNNITQLQVGSQTNNYTYSTNNLLTAITGSTNENIIYDANGNVIKKGDDHYLYDAAGHLIHFNNASHAIDFKYDPLGHVITTREDGKSLIITVYDRDGKLMYKENRDLVNNTNEITDYIYLEGKLVATATHSVYDAQNVTFHYLITNPLGSPIASITNGQVDWTQRYRPFGIELKQRPVPEDHIGFTGKETVKDMNLVNMNARYYAPSLGRFMAYDPAPPEVDNIFSFNRYAYANNNPLRYIDPTGLWSISGMFSGDTGHDIADHANSFASGMNKGISGGLIDKKYNHEHQIDHMVGETLGMVVGMGIGTTEARIATEAGGLIKSAITAVMEEKNVAGQVNATRGSKVFTTYTKVNPATGETYVGRTSGYGDIESIVERRDAYHHMNAKGFEAARPDVASTSKAAIRGREQMMIEHHGGAKSMGGTSGNAINGISRFNPRKQGYVDAARNEFGDVS